MASDGSSDTAGGVSLARVQAAEAIIREAVPPSPMIPSSTLSQRLGAEVLLKAECLQRTGSFKIRGGYHKLSRLSEAERAAGVIAASAGNHAQGVALAARLLGMRATIVMPRGTPLTKQLRTAGYGAQVVLHGQDYDEAYAQALGLAQEGGLTYVHAFDDPDIIAGQGTCALEILDQMPGVEAVLVPVGGGGLISGIGAVLRERAPHVALYGVEAEGAAAARAALQAGGPVLLAEAHTLAEGIKVRRIGALPYACMSRSVTSVALVSEEEITSAIAWLLSDAKLVVEGAGAVGVAALMVDRIPELKGKKVCVVLSGGNIDLGQLARVVERSLTQAGRHTWLQLMVPDRPGVLSQAVALIAQEEVNILDVEHHRAGWRVPVGQVALSFLLETRDSAQSHQLAERIRALGWEVLADAAPTPGAR